MDEPTTSLQKSPKSRVPEGQAIVARRFIAGLAIHRDLRPGGTLEVGSGLLRIRRAGYVQGANFHPAGHITHKRGTQSKDQRLPKSLQLPFVIFASSGANFLGLLLSPTLRIQASPPGRRPYGVPEPGDKSPGYCHLSL